MTVLRCTQKLLAELRLKPNAGVGDDETGWHANLLLVERRKCALFTHDQTLFSFLLCGLTRPDFAYFPEVFGQGLFKALLLSGFDQQQIERMLDTTREIRYTKTSSRSVLGSMNDMKQILEWVIRSRGGLAVVDPAELLNLLNSIPFKAIGYDKPLERMRDFLRLGKAKGTKATHP